MNSPEVVAANATRIPLGLVRRAKAVTVEAWAMGWSSPATATVTVLAVAAMCLAVLMTQGRAVGARDAVVATLDDAGSRTIIVRAEDQVGITTSVLDRLSQLDGVVWYGAFGPAADVAGPGGSKVPARTWYGGSPDALDLPDQTVLPGQDAFTTPTALDRLGLLDGYGTAHTDDGPTYNVVGTFEPPAHLDVLGPLLVVPQDPDGSESVRLLVVVASATGQVEPVTATVTDMLGALDPQAMTVTASEDLASLQTDINASLSGFTTTLVASILALTAVLVGILQLGLVLLRRKDFGRRRALGASQGMVMTLLLVQTTLLAGIGALVGTLTATGILAITGAPIAGPKYLTGVGLLAITTALTGSLLPAVLAARRDPLQELRVP